MSASKIIGIVGGMGPLAGKVFFEKICSQINARKDSDYPDMIMTSFSSTPDRTAFIIGENAEDPRTKIKRAIDILVFGGADLITMPCNTADCFYDALSSYSPVPMLSIIRETVKKAYESGAKRLGIMATDGTIKSGEYQRICAEYGISSETPAKELQASLVNNIYLNLKTGIVPENAIKDISEKMLAKCDHIAFACTELSLIHKSNWSIGELIIDSSDALAEAALRKCEVIIN